MLRPASAMKLCWPSLVNFSKTYAENLWQSVQTKHPPLRGAQLESELAKGSELFLDADGIDFAHIIETLHLRSTDSRKLIVVEDNQGREFIFKPRGLEGDLMQEFVVLRLLSKYTDLVPQSYIVRVEKRDRPFLLGTEKLPGINVKEILYGGQWRLESTKIKIEEMLGQSFTNEDDAVRAMATILLNHSDFEKNLDRMRDIFQTHEIIPNDFQFMVNYDHTTGQLSMTLIDLGHYKKISSFGRTAWQGIDYTLGNLLRSANTSIKPQGR